MTSTIERILIVLAALISSPMVGAASYTYDELNRLAAVTYDDGAKIAYTYDAPGNVGSIIMTAATVATTTTTGAPTSTTTGISTTTTASTTTTTNGSGGGPVTLNFALGWNLLGNGVDAPIAVSSAFGDPAIFTTVWKWIASGPKWAFYTSSLAGQQLIDYATAKGYDILTTVNGGEGFWVNAKLAGSVDLSNGNAISVTTLGSSLTAGWNLVAVGETATPKQFCDAQSGGVTTLWSWDATNSAWYFYASTLDASGDLGTYINSKGYRDFTAYSKTLGPGVGFWVNRP